MIDHIGFPVSDYAKSKAFYEKAFAPLGYSMIMEVGAEQTESGALACGFGKDSNPVFWIGGEGGLKGVIHVALTSRAARSSMRFIKPRLRPAAWTTARRVSASIIIRLTMAPTCSIPTGTTSKRSVTNRNEAAP
jgi:hypothetical protein